MKKHVEILAPAGSKESLRAAVQAGASAVYLGGSKFGARAFADNFDEDGLRKAIDYVHLHGRKIYLTVNTLLKEQEIEESLYEYLLPVYRQGLDAVIVQDPGVADFIRMNFPGLAMHASTQMTVTGAPGANFMKEQGIERVVPARELSLREIQKLKDGTGMEVECFVHGALCYCYSGQCYFSSLIGGRSGNRGQCAQPCRLPYQMQGMKDPAYLMSLKDICTIDYIPQLIEAGIDSFKIEGRMKRPEYVAGVTRLYKKYADLYYNVGSKGYHIEEEDREVLMDLYNRGGFHSGYYMQKNGADMVAQKRPNHAGVPAVKIESQKGQRAEGKALTHISKGDVIELSGYKDDYTFGSDIRQGDPVVLSLRKGVHLGRGIILNRTKNEALLSELKSLSDGPEVQEKIKGKLILSSEDSGKLIMTYLSTTVTVLCSPCERAVNQPTSSVRIEEQMRKTGNTPFRFETLEIEMEENLFVPMQRLNELRRAGIEELSSALLKSCMREGVMDHRDKDQLKAEPCTHVFPRQFCASAETREQFEVLLSHQAVSRIYLDCCMMEASHRNPKMKEYAAACRDAGKEVYFIMPYIFREETVCKYEADYDTLCSMGFDGMLVRNYESVYFLKEHDYKGNIVTDHNLYQFNKYAGMFFRRNGIEHGTAPIELNESELLKSGAKSQELIIYGYLPMMVSAQCTQKTCGGCTHKDMVNTMTDRYKNEFTVKNFCDFCYNVIYNHTPLMLADLDESLHKLNPAGLRLRFTLEDAKETEEAVHFCESALLHHTAAEWKKELTRGHYRRGIK